MPYAKYKSCLFDIDSTFPDLLLGFDSLMSLSKLTTPYEPFGVHCAFQFTNSCDAHNIFYVSDHFFPVCLPQSEKKSWKRFWRNFKTITTIQLHGSLDTLNYAVFLFVRHTHTSAHTDTDTHTVLHTHKHTQTHTRTQRKEVGNGTRPPTWLANASATQAQVTRKTWLS